LVNLGKNDKAVFAGINSLKIFSEWGIFYQVLCIFGMIISRTRRKNASLGLSSNCTTPFRCIVFLALLNQDMKFPNYISSTLILCAFAPLREANSY
jgi:hypothetical protein